MLHLKVKGHFDKAVNCPRDVFTKRLLIVFITTHLLDTVTNNPRDVVTDTFVTRLLSPWHDYSSFCDFLTDL